MARILLIDIPLPNEKKFGKFLSRLGSRFPPLNIILLGTILHQKGHSVDFIFEDDSYDDIRQKLKSFNPHIVGITCMTMSYYYLKDVAEIIRDYNKNIHIIAGGFHPSIFPDDVMRENNEVLAVFIGEADNTLADMVSLLEKEDFSSEQLKVIPNIVFRAPDGSLHKTDSQPFIDNLDDLPFLDYSLANNYFKRFHPAVNRHFLPLPNAAVYVSRGCPFNCVFCGRSITGSRIRSHSIEYRIDLIKHLKKKYNIGSIVFTDELFTSKKSDILKFCENIRKEGLENILWACGGRVDSLDDEICQSMFAAGCRQITFGLESGSQKILNNLNKKTTVEKARTALRLCRKNNLTVTASVILGSFGETISTMRETYDFIMSNPIDYVGLCFFTPMPGSESYEVYKNYGELLTTDFRQFNTFSGLVFIPFGLKKEDIIYWRKKIYRDFYFRPERIYREMRYLNNKASWKYVFKTIFK
ncbi:MAG: hypothetical protein CVU52_05890 [Deltaproteobacteria bacterium HGW-Deltaproteobacteria-10]|nr:MAG: hypothetical protein CVU52_05890 [Deltaproteobacteria bacterium HGW-Deltaproteobacteria-10]